jgi:muconolactone delta-isomerase
MQFLVLSRRRTEFSDSDFNAILPLESARARYLYSIGFTRQLWHRGDISGACQIAEAADETTAREILATLPLAQANMIEFTIVPLRPYAGFYP